MADIVMSPYFSPEHKMFRSSLRDFLAQEITPHLLDWEKDNKIPRWAWTKLGEMGYLGLCHEELYGGMDLDWFTNIVFCEELGHTLNNGFAVAVAVHEYMATNHITHIGDTYQKEEYLVPAILGNKIAALGLSEPQVGSDIRDLKTFARKKGDDYILNGSKIFITNGFYADFITLCAQTEKGLSLFIVDLESNGVSRNKLDKIGWHSSDTAEIFFDNVLVPARNLLGEEGKGFYYLSESLQSERLVLSIISLGIMESTLEITKDYLHTREAFGKSLSQFQALRHRLADLEAEMEAVRQLIYHTAWLAENGASIVKPCSMCKLLSAELHIKLVNECLQMFGGYGYMEEYPIGRIYRDARAASLIGGTSEIMREIIAKMSIDGINYKKAYNRS